MALRPWFVLITALYPLASEPPLMETDGTCGRCCFENQLRFAHVLIAKQLSLFQHGRRR